MKSSPLLILAFSLFWSVSALAQTAPPPTKSDGEKSNEKKWYEFVFFSPLVSGIVVSGMLGWFIQRKIEDIRVRNAISAEKEKKSFESLREYQDEATTLLAPICETYNRLSKLQDEAPRIDDNKLLIEYLGYVLEPYSRFRVAYSEKFRLYTRRFCPPIVQAFDFISDDVCNTIIFISSDLETRRSELRMQTVRESVERLRQNIECIESHISSFGSFPETKAEH